MFFFQFVLFPASIYLAESVGPVGTPILVPLTIALLMLFIFGWGIVQRSWQTTVADREAAERGETSADNSSSDMDHTH